MSFIVRGVVKGVKLEKIHEGTREEIKLNKISVLTVDGGEADIVKVSDFNLYPVQLEQNVEIVVTVYGSPLKKGGVILNVSTVRDAPPVIIGGTKKDMKV